MSAPRIFPLELRVPGRVFFGPGAVFNVGTEAAAMGRRALLVTGSGSLEKFGHLHVIETGLQTSGVAWTRYRVAQEPSVEAVDEAAAAGRAAGCDIVIAVGGGSAIDLGKSVAGMIPNEGSVLAYLEGVGEKKVMVNPPLPFMAVPTTAGTGSEATKNAVISGRAEGQPFKKSFRDPRLVPAVAIVEGALAHGCPPELTVACGMDALTQLIESMVSLNATATTDALAIVGIEAVGSSFQRAVADGADMEARDGMACAAFLSGVCLSNAGLGAVHGLASPVSAYAPIPHGAICAALLPHVTEANRKALQAGRGRQEALAGYVRAERALGAPVPEFCRRFKVRGLASFGLREADLPRVVAGATSGSMKTNPVELSPRELEDILRAAL